MAENATTSTAPITCLAAAGQPLRPNQHLDGVNLLPLFRGSGLAWPRSDLLALSALQRSPVERPIKRHSQGAAEADRDIRPPRPRALQPG